MKSFFSEYAGITVAAVVVTLLIALASPVGASVKDSVTGLIIKFSGTSESLTDTMSNTVIDLNNNIAGNEVIYVMLDAPSGPVNGTTNVTFRSEAPLEDLVAVKVDGAVVDPINYTATSGSTIIELKKEYIATLADGEHTMVIESKKGSATMVFAKEAPQANLISFTINNIAYQAEEGMTWGEWVTSKYNIESSNICIEFIKESSETCRIFFSANGDAKWVYFVSRSDKIKLNENYEIGGDVMFINREPTIAEIESAGKVEIDDDIIVLEPDDIDIPIILLP